MSNKINLLAIANYPIFKIFVKNPKFLKNLGIFSS